MKIEKLYPVCKDYLWGGTRLREKYGKETNCTPCAESWELSLHPDGLTRLGDGRTLAEAIGPKEIGTRAAKFDRQKALRSTESLRSEQLTNPLTR